MINTELPDFEDMYNLAVEIKKKKMRVAILETELEADEAKINKEVVTNSKYFINGNPPSQAFISRAYLPIGLEGELLPKREELATLKAEIEYLKMKIDIDKTLVEVWRTESANKRAAVSA